MAFLSITFIKGSLSSGTSLLNRQHRNYVNPCISKVSWSMTASNGSESASRKSSASDKQPSKSESSHKESRQEISKAQEVKAESAKTTTSDSGKAVTQKPPVDKGVAKEPVEQKKTVSNKPKWSKALPFMLWPQNLDGTMAGDVGFDPFGFTNVFDVKWMREAELKHCRIAMLAALGFIVQELWTFPYPYFSKVPPVLAHDVYVKTGGMSQILLFVIFFEVISLFAVSQMMEGKREPGVFHFDPLGLAKDPDTFRKYEWSELRNGRLAMIAVGGFIHQYWVTKQGIFEQLANFRPLSP
ncbi:light-harvesting complex protein [Galdieria sulphuraria]|uniref:Light-harvesting complex protein n=1 Tax=Galdieria sulphuraria TaxID=130081 RepID=M2VZV1_GALSU|nr:light-harvesting complex protein [Galdieria sulphuraria]EME28871.1 light-harvesting complex protein [Galdieria sulphuraria]|eukprot:XP_005705391.1 light-harvesting complex protein [Galdieria sulphuraria]